MRAYNYIGKLNSIEDPVKKKTVILSMSQNDAPIATEEMRSIIASPLSSGKGEVIKSLFNHPRPELLNDLLREAADYGSYHQTKAIFALGAYEDKEVEVFLVGLLNSTDSSVRSSAAKSLGRVGHRDSVEIVRNLASQAERPLDKINYFIALKNMDSSGVVFQNIFRESRSLSNGQFRQTYYSLAADLLDFKPQLSQIYSSKNLQKGDGLRDFLDQTRDLGYFYKHHKDLIQWFADSDWFQIGEFCQKSLRNIEDLNLSDPQLNLRTAVMEEALKLKENESQTLYDDALSCVYFTYQILVN